MNFRKINGNNSSYNFFEVKKQLKISHLYNNNEFDKKI